MEQPKLSYQEVEELLPGYVLGNLSAAEMLAVDAYLSAQADLNQELAELEETMVALALSTPDTALAPEVKTSFMAKIAADLGLHSTPAVTVATARVVQSAAAPARDSFVDWLRDLFRGPGPYAVLATGAFAVALIIGLFALNINNQLGDAEAALSDATLRQEALAEENGALATELAAAEATNVSLQNELMSLEAAFQEVRFDEQQLQVVSYATHSVSMEPHEAYPNIRGFFYFGSQHEPALLVLHGLEKLPDDLVYQFWLVTPEGEPVPHELLQVEGPQAPTVETIELDEFTPEFSAVALSIEPAGGSQNPTGTILLQGAERREG